MNSRLQLHYESLVSSNLEPFLQNELEIDTNWGNQVWGMFLISDLEENVKSMLSQFQKDLAQLEPGNLTFPPPTAQHLTINQVVHCLGNYAQGNKNTWELKKESFLSAFKKLDRVCPMIPVTFSQLIATTGGIIWCAYDENDELENLRNDLFSKLPFPEETTKKVHVIHTTVCRYKNRLNNPQAVLDYISNHQKKVQMKINNIILRNETTFPSINFEDIAQIELK